jgi:GntR family negative regulator for fad regulon and positive regulator of fabA
MNAVTQESATDRAHRMLIERILDQTYPIGAEIPGERILSKELGLARNALREALQRLNHNGWLEIHQGRPTRVRDYRRDGNLTILLDLLKVERMPLNFVPDLLHMWALLAHDYTELAVRNDHTRIAERLELYESLADEPEACARAMWQLHRALIDYAGNQVYGLLFNSFAQLHERLSVMGFEDPVRRDDARALWAALYDAVLIMDEQQAAELVADYIRVDMERGQTAAQQSNDLMEPALESEDNA